MKLRFGGAWPAFKGCCWPNTRAAAAGPSGFTLIELLVVVSIISILAAMAVPNYLNAQTRAKWAVVKSDMRTLTVAIESYAVDHADYPIRRDFTTARPFMPLLADQARQMSALTTPISYISSLPVDPFVKNQIPADLNARSTQCQAMSDYQPRGKRLIDYFDPWQAKETLRNDQVIPRELRRSYLTIPDGTYALISVGPDGYFGVGNRGFPGGSPCQPWEYQATFYQTYDPTNGVSSTGNVYRISTMVENSMKFFFK